MEACIMEPVNVVFVGIGGILIGKIPLKISTCLGSCIAVCLYDPRTHVGGLVHIASASSKHIKDRSNIMKGKYADLGVAELIKQLKDKYGVEKESLVVKVFGGANVLKVIKEQIGLANEQAVLKAIKELGLRVVASHTGGEKGYRIQLDLNTGKVLCYVFEEEPKEY